MDLKLVDAGRVIGNYTIVCKVGHGSYSNVFKAYRGKDTINLFALKEVDINKHSESMRVNILNELRVHASVEHPNLIKFEETFIDFDTGNLIIITELAGSGDIRSLVKKFKLNK
jgi:NIMA (never in mitosis gene a)-related kinase 1/4/5